MSRGVQATVRLQASNEDRFMVLLGVLLEAGVDAMPVGACTVVVTQDDMGKLDAEQAEEVATLTGTPIAGTQADPVPPGDASVATDQRAVADVEPPRSGAGATRDAWAAYARTLNLDVPADAGRDDIIKAVEATR